MGEEGVSNQAKRTDEERLALRQHGRAWAKELQIEAEATGRHFDWFEELYVRADGESGYIPWEMAAPRFKLRKWLQDNSGDGLTALDVGCGLGDNAACLAEAGYWVTAFDISETAVRWAEDRFASPSINFVQCDLFTPPDHWLGAFDLVHETYNLQALPRDRVADAMTILASFIKPAGRLVVISRIREDHEPVDGPPWPLTLSELEPFKTAGLNQATHEVFHDQREDPIRHVLVEYERK